MVICARGQSPTGLAGTLKETVIDIRNAGANVFAIDSDVTDEPQANEAASIKGEGVVDVLHRLMQQHRLPRTIRVDNGPELTSKRLDPVGLPERSGTGLQPARQAHGQRLHRGFQRALPAGVLERELVPVPGGR